MNSLNSLFTPKQIAILQAPNRWTVIKDPSASPTPQGADQKLEWYRKHNHSHSHAEILLALAGSTTYGIGDHLVSLGPGTVLFFDRMVPHQERYVSTDTSLDHLWLSIVGDHFTANVLRVRCGRIGERPAAAVVCDAHDAGLDFLALTTDLRRRESAAWPLKLHALTAGMVAALLERISDGAPESSSRVQQRIIAGIRRHLEETAGRDDTLESLARIAGYSRFHFLRLFKAETGVTVHQYIDHCRRQKVQAMLNENRSKKEIAYTLGFSHPQAFSRWVRQNLPD